MNTRRVFLASTAAGTATGWIVHLVTRHTDRFALVAPLGLAIAAACVLFVLRLVRGVRRPAQPPLWGPEAPSAGGPTPASARRSTTGPARRPHWVWRTLVAIIGWVALAVAFPALIVAAATPSSWLPFLVALAGWCVVIAALADAIAWWLLPDLTMKMAAEMAAGAVAEAHPLVTLPVVAGYELWRQSRTGGTETTRPEILPGP